MALTRPLPTMRSWRFRAMSPGAATWFGPFAVDPVDFLPRVGVVAGDIDLYNRIRRHSSCEMKPPIEFEAILATRGAEPVDDEEAA